jgi:hypothetical protein
VLAGAGESFIADTYGATPQETAPLILLRQRGTETLFVAAIQMLQEGEAPLAVAWGADGAFQVGKERIALAAWPPEVPEPAVEAAGEQELQETAVQ